MAVRREEVPVKLLWLLATAFQLSACDSTEVKREIGYKGKARVNPWPAAERFAARRDKEVRSLASRTAPDCEDAAWFVPASLLSTRTPRRVTGRTIRPH